MKYGLMIYQNTDNIGDDVQAYATEQFLPQVDTIVDREKLDTFYSESGEQVAVILNGWFMHRKYNWPPSPYLRPLLISMHFSYNSGNIVAGDSFLEGLGGEYLCQHGPVGARDSYTLALLKKKNIPAYLSGCMTLTLQGKPGVERSDELLLIDTDARVAQYLDAKGIKYTTSTNKVSYGSHDFWPTRRKKVEDYIERIQRAKCVITTRLHAALPCLALGTPVLMLYEDAFYDRVGSFLPYLHHCSVEQFCTGQANFDVEHPPANKEDYRSFRDSLIAAVKTFVASVPKLPQATAPNPNDFYRLWVEKAVFQKQLIENANNRYQKVIDEQVMWNHQLEEAKSYLEQNNRDLRHVCARLEAENRAEVTKKDELFKAKQLTEAECKALREEAERAKEVWEAKQALEAECARLKLEAERAKEVWEAKQALEAECIQLKQQCDALINKRFSNRVKRIIRKLPIVNHNDS